MGGKKQRMKLRKRIYIEMGNGLWISIYANPVLST